MSTIDHGRFPFGQPNTERPLRPAKGTTEVLVVGVYPSAFHVRWTPPPDIDPRPRGERGRPYLGSLAVDVEPTVFWDGTDPSPAEVLARWQELVGFDPGRDGTVSAGTNGPSGAGVIAKYLSPMRVDAANVAFTDAVPWYFVKHGKGSQGAAVKKYNELAAAMKREPAELPKRPSPSGFGAILDSGERRDLLRQEIASSGAKRLITLGQEALDAVLVVADAPSDVQTTLRPDGYGKTAGVQVGGASFEWTPLVHPAFVRQTADALWTQALADWSSAG